MEVLLVVAAQALGEGGEGKERISKSPRSGQWLNWKS